MIDRVYDWLSNERMNVGPISYSFGEQLNVFSISKSKRMEANIPAGIGGAYRLVIHKILQ